MQQGSVGLHRRVQIPNLASHVLAAAARRLPQDWQDRYQVQPLLLETLVDRSRYSGACYRTASWLSVGLTQGRGRMDRAGSARGERKEILVFPLRRKWRQWLCSEEPDQRFRRKDASPAGQF